VRDRELARDILQTGFLKAVEKAASVRDDQSVVKWFYRILRNDVTDHHRRGSARRRALAQQAPSDPTAADSGHEAVHGGVPCRCLASLLPTLPPQYASILQRIDLDGSSVSEVAHEYGLSANNVRVRLHRARRALRKQLERQCGTCADEGCRDCTCHHEHGAGEQPRQRAHGAHPVGASGATPAVARAGRAMIDLAPAGGDHG
jgi:RNA polymerase sigma factor (sigma-70 family)